MSPLTIERRGPADDRELFRLYEEVFGQALSEGSRKRWHWQYLDNPANRPEGPEIWVASDGDQILGQYASMPVRLSWAGREVQASWGMDVFVRAEARGRGVGVRLFTTWSDHVDVALGLGLTPSSYGLFRKLRYEDVGPVPFYQKILDPRAVVGRRLGAVLGTIAAPMLRLLLVGWQHEDSASGAGSLDIRTITSFGEEYDRLWEKAGPSYAMCVRRDRAYLGWKYARCPHRTYDILEARRGGELAGYAISRHEEHRGLRLGWILDIFTHADDDAAKDALLVSVLRHFAAQGVARAQAFSMSAALGAALRRRGFRPGRSPMQFCVRSRVEPNAFADRDRWHVVFGDSDMDR